MDKLLLSPEYSVPNTEVDNNNDTNKVMLEIQTIETDVIQATSPISCKSASPIFDVISSPTTELSEFLILNNKVNHRMTENPLTPPLLEYDTLPEFFPSDDSPDSDELELNVLPQLQNVIAIANLHCKLDLRRIAMYGKNVEYNSRRLPILYMRIRKPSALALIFANGRLICTGSSNIRLSHQAARKFARIIQRLGFAVKFGNYKVQNLIASCDVQFPIRLELFELFMHTNCVYEPELFPGLIFRVARSCAQIMIFSSGKVILSGSKQAHELQRSFREIYPLLKLFEKKILEL